MTILSTGPCGPWEPLDCPAWPDSLAGVKDNAIMAATEVLWELTKRQFGSCTMTLRPCRTDCAGDNALAWLYGSWLPTWGGNSGWGWPFPALLGGRWYNLGCGACGDTCSCAIVHQVQLPYPIATITQVKVDGVTLDSGAYRVDDWQFLVRLDGNEWPQCNNLNKADTEVGTWSVTGTWGTAVPMMGRVAVGALALETAKALCGDGSCQLSPAQVREINRQGVRKAFITAGDKGSQTGLMLVDRFINTYNPTGSNFASIYNIDAPRSRRVGT